jgi:hypothetical protein
VNGGPTLGYFTLCDEIRKMGHKTSTTDTEYDTGFGMQFKALLNVA